MPLLSAVSLRPKNSTNYHVRTILESLNILYPGHLRDLPCIITKNYTLHLNGCSVAYKRYT